jgi:hypothetical protein
MARSGPSNHIVECRCETVAALLAPFQTRLMNKPRVQRKSSAEFAFGGGTSRTRLPRDLHNKSRPRGLEDRLRLNDDLRFDRARVPEDFLNFEAADLHRHSVNR